MENYIETESCVYGHSVELDSTKVLKELSFIFAEIIPGWKPVYRSKNIQNSRKLNVDGSLGAL